jgi:isocitrate/isopropylmalate dehydrogenase
VWTRPACTQPVACGADFPCPPALPPGSGWRTSTSIELLFGDILSDIVCARAGSPALCGSATINPGRGFGNGITALFEPAHGSSPHRTGSRRSNPTGAWLALADLLAWCPDLSGLGLHAEVRSALDQVITTAPPTYDLAPPGAATIDLDEFNERVFEALGHQPTAVTVPPQQVPPSSQEAR